MKTLAEFSIAEEYIFQLFLLPYMHYNNKYWYYLLDSVSFRWLLCPMLNWIGQY